MNSEFKIKVEEKTSKKPILKLKKKVRTKKDEKTEETPLAEKVEDAAV